MRRREFISLSVGAQLYSAGRWRRVRAASEDASHPAYFWSPVRKCWVRSSRRFRDLGYIEGKTIQIDVCDRRKAVRNLLPELAAELVL